MKRLRIGVIFGGRSVEHEVSLVSARSVLAAIDPARYEVVPIGVTRSGKWLTSSEIGRFLEDGVQREAGEHAALLADPSVSGLVRIGEREDRIESPAVPVSTHDGPKMLDVVFPLIHGGYGEDGKLQGLLEMADLPYVGSGVLGSALGMDKEVAKRLFAAAGLPVVPYLVIRRHEWETEATSPSVAHRAPSGQASSREAHGEAPSGRERLRARLKESLGYPCFVKPAGLGSSVGVSRAGGWDEARQAIDEALLFDDKVLVERAVDAREVEVAVLGNDHPEASVVGEIVTRHAFYDYEAKYHDDGTRLVIPAVLPETLASRIRMLALDAFRVLELAGMARVDFLLDRTTAEPYLNEVNTVPGFTPVSMYPKLWEASGLAYPALVDRLIELAIERHEAKRRLRTSRTEPDENAGAPGKDDADDRVKQDAGARGKEGGHA